MDKSDAIYLAASRKACFYKAIWQAFAVLLPIQTAGVMGEDRIYDFVCALRAVTSLPLAQQEGNLTNSPRWLG